MSSPRRYWTGDRGTQRAEKKKENKRKREGERARGDEREGERKEGRARERAMVPCQPSRADTYFGPFG